MNQKVFCFIHISYLLIVPWCTISIDTNFINISNIRKYFWKYWKYFEYCFAISMPSAHEQFIINNCYRLLKKLVLGLTFIYIEVCHSISPPLTIFLAMHKTCILSNCWEECTMWLWTIENPRDAWRQVHLLYGFYGTHKPLKRLQTPGRSKSCFFRFHQLKAGYFSRKACGWKIRYT